MRSATKMITSRTPLRISFAGGGSDFPAYTKYRIGAVVSAAIDKYVYVVLKKRFDKQIRVAYNMTTEFVDSVDEIKHDLVRECLRKVGIYSGIEIATFADIPAEGTGLGSSSAIAVGLLNALYAYKHQELYPHRLAAEACEIEINVLGKPIGKQDQAAAAWGNIRYYQFQLSGKIDSMQLQPREPIGNSLLLFYTGITRKADTILCQQNNNIVDNIDIINQIANQADELANHFDVDMIGQTLRSGWELKKQLADGITNEFIDDIHARVMDAGALGCKVTGAGGGGFVLVCTREPNRVRAALNDLQLQELKFGFDQQGSKIILRTGD